MKLFLAVQGGSIFPIKYKPLISEKEQRETSYVLPWEDCSHVHTHTQKQAGNL